MKCPGAGKMIYSGKSLLYQYKKLNSNIHHAQKNPGVIAGTCNSNAEEAETGGFL